MKTRVFKKSRQEYKEAFGSRPDHSLVLHGVLHRGDAGVAAFNAAKEPWPCMIRAEVTHSRSLARSRPIDRVYLVPRGTFATFIAEASRGNFLGEPLAYAAAIVRGNEITGNAAPRLV